jgi:hypothetical protein
MPAMAGNVEAAGNVKVFWFFSSEKNYFLLILPESSSIFASIC